MAWPIIAIAALCAVFLKSDSPEAAEAPPVTPRTDPPPPQDPPGSGSPNTPPRGINPALFQAVPPSWETEPLPNTTSLERELADLFNRGYTLDSRQRLVVTDRDAADALQERLDQITDQAMRSPLMARTYDQRTFTKYAYLTHADLTPEERGFLYRLDRGLITANEATLWVDRRAADFFAAYEGRGDPTTDPFMKRQGILYFALRELLEEQTLETATTESARQIADSSVLLTGNDREIRIRMALYFSTTPELREALQFVQAHTEDLSSAASQALAAGSLPSVMRNLLPHLGNLSQQEGRRLAYQIADYILFVMIFRGGGASMEAFMNDECRSDSASTSPEICSLRTDLRLAKESPDPFDNARMRHRLLEHLAAFYAYYSGLSATERISRQVFLLEGELGTALVSGDFGPPFTPDEIGAVFQQVRSQTHRTHIPASRGYPLSWSELDQIRQPTEIPLSDLPREIQDLARQVTIRVPRTQTTWVGTLWDYLQANVDSVILTRQGPHLGGPLGEPDGTANRLFKTLVIDIDGQDNRAVLDPLEILGTLAHEAYHNDYFHHIVSGNPRLAWANTLNERNAHLLQAQILTERLRMNMVTLSPLLSNSSYQLTSTDNRMLLESLALVAAITSHRFIALSANLPLDYPLEDATLRAEVYPDLSIETLGRYPTFFEEDYLRGRRMTPERFAQTVLRDLDRQFNLSLKLERLVPRVRQFIEEEARKTAGGKGPATAGPAGSSTAVTR